MDLLNIFEEQTTKLCLERLENLKADTQPQWGKMSAPQMLAHLNVPYHMTYGKIDPGFNSFTRFLLKMFIKSGVVNDKPYKKNSRTAPIFLITDERNFEKEKLELINYIKQTQDLGESEFDGRHYVSFGKMSSKEWSNLFYKHMDHHFTQFGI